MRRIAAATAVVATTAVVAGLLGLGANASAQATVARIEAVPQTVKLDHNPWTPTGNLAVKVTNFGPGAADGYFVLHLPNGVELDAAADCRQADGPDQPAYICGGKRLAVRATATYRVKLSSTTLESVFGVRANGGWVSGKNPRGGNGTRASFAVDWPAKLPVRLTATAGPRTGGHVDIAVRVTNTGRSVLNGYSLNVTTPAGVTVVSPTCSDSGRMTGAGCEVYRTGPVRPSTTETFTVRLAVDDARRSVKLYLAPTNRYLNKDTQVTLQLG
jgi:hypothetical protein